MKNFQYIKLSGLKARKLARLTEFLSLDILNPGVFLGGGALRTLVDQTDVICDYDLFFLDFESMEETRTVLTAHGFYNYYECPEGKLFSYERCGVKIQCICEKYYEAPAQVIRDFDFTACSAVTDGNLLVCHPRFPFDVRRKVLTIESLTYPVATMKRIMKYAAKGFKVSGAIESFVKLVSLKSWNDNEMRHYID